MIMYISLPLIGLAVYAVTSLVMTYTGRRTAPLPRGWAQRAIAVLRRDPLCQWGSIPEDLASPGECRELSAEVDHTGDPNDHSMDKLRGLCTRHHATRTGRQGAAAYNAIRPSRKRPKEPHPAYKQGRGD